MNCVICNGVLGSDKQKYCSSSCYRFYRQEWYKAWYRKHNPLLPKIACIFCSTIFQPRSKRHKCCDVVCRELLEKKKQKGNRKKPKEPKEPKEYKKGRTIELPPLPSDKSKYSGQIEEFKQNGGKVNVLPPQVSGRTPDVNITSLAGWSIETLFGFGYEIQLMEELNDVG
tara:strand:+ start:530 stop:1039 length:510 start_codon:yes stop_codon:yes gene_type:complete